MGNCKNCGQDTDGKKIYCTLTCRNIYVNKHIRDYRNNGENLKKKSIENYNNSPKKCKKCQSPIDYDNRYNLYCSIECRKTNINKTNRKGVKYNMSENGRKNIVESNIKRLGDEYQNYILNPNCCLNCKTSLDFKKRKNIYCSVECRRKYEKNLLDEYSKYKLETKFNFNLNDYPDEYDFSLIEKYGWYKPKNRGDNLNGISRDHIYSVNEGFINKINPKIISHPANCRLMKHSENISKNKKSDITIEDLLMKIEEWNLKYDKK